VPEVARIPYILAKVFPALSSLKWYDFVGNFFIDNASRPVLEEVWKQLKVLRGQGDDNHNSHKEWEEGSDDSDDSEDAEEWGEDHWMGAV
jgi:hypothetical protein